MGGQRDYEELESVELSPEDSARLDAAIAQADSERPPTPGSLHDKKLRAQEPVEIRWFIASVDAREGDKANGRKRPPPRTWGFWRTKEEAEAYIRDHASLLAENGYYSHAVIEPHECGVGNFGGMSSSHWFKLEAQKRTRLGDRGPDYVEPPWESDKATSCEKPAHLKHAVNFTLG